MMSLISVSCIAAIPSMGRAFNVTLLLRPVSPPKWCMAEYFSPKPCSSVLPFTLCVTEPARLRSSVSVKPPRSFAACDCSHLTPSGVTSRKNRVVTSMSKNAPMSSNTSAGLALVFAIWVKRGRALPVIFINTPANLITWPIKLRTCRFSSHPSSYAYRRIFLNLDHTFTNLIKLRHGVTFYGFEMFVSNVRG